MTGYIVDQSETYCGVVTTKGEENKVRLERQGGSKEKSRRWHNHIQRRKEEQTLLILVDIPIMPSMFIHDEQ
jgi:hypothetical protein